MPATPASGFKDNAASAPASKPLSDLQPKPHRYTSDGKKKKTALLAAGQKTSSNKGCVTGAGGGETA